MGKLYKGIIALSLVSILLIGCGAKEATQDEWLLKADLDATEPVDDLYQKALDEDVLIVYTVTTRAASTKDAFEKAYPGLSVEIRDLRSPNLVDEVEENYKKGSSACDVVLCNDNSGQFKERLVDTGIVVPYIPSDIAAHMNEDSVGEMISFLSEAEILYYSSKNFDECPIDNLWALTDPAYKGRIYMPNPLRSFSTYALCGESLYHDDEMAKAYAAYTGKDMSAEDKERAADIFWQELAKNVVFSNSSDEVIEALNDGSADFGFAVSSKLRLNDVGYEIQPVWNIDPFSGCCTSYSVMLARNSKNINTAKLFIRFLLGEADGQGEGYKPFCTAGTWPARDDVPDQNEVLLSDIDLIKPDQDRMIADRKEIEAFWTEILQDNVSGKE